MKNKIGKIRFFTVLELVVAMTVFSILMLALMRTFSATQDVFRKTSARADSYDNARIAMDMLAADLSSVFYDSTDDRYFSFSDTNSDLKFLTMKSSYVTNLDDAARKNTSLLTKVNYVLENFTSEHASGLTLHQLRYKYVQRPLSSASQTSLSDFFTNAAYTNDLILIQNVVSLNVRRLNWNASGTVDCSSGTPAMIEVTLSVLDDDPQVHKQYKAESDADTKDAMTRKFSRIILLQK